MDRFSPSFIWKSSLPPAKKLILLCLEHGTHERPGLSLNEIAAGTGYSRRRLMTLLKNLRAEGWVEELEATGERHKLYRIGNKPCRENLSPLDHEILSPRGEIFSSPKPGGEKFARQAESSCEIFSPLEPKGEIFARPRGEIFSPQPLLEGEVVSAQEGEKAVRYEIFSNRSLNITPVNELRDIERFKYVFTYGEERVFEVKTLKRTEGGCGGEKRANFSPPSAEVKSLHPGGKDPLSALEAKGPQGKFLAELLKSENASRGRIPAALRMAEAYDLQTLQALWEWTQKNAAFSRLGLFLHFSKPDVPLPKDLDLNRAEEPGSPPEESELCRLLNELPERTRGWFDWHEWVLPWAVELHKKGLLEAAAQWRDIVLYELPLGFNPEFGRAEVRRWLKTFAHQIDPSLQGIDIEALSHEEAYRLLRRLVPEALYKGRRWDYIEAALVRGESPTDEMGRYLITPSVERAMTFGGAL